VLTPLRAYTPLTLHSYAPFTAQLHSFRCTVTLISLHSYTPVTLQSHRRLRYYTVDVSITLNSFDSADEDYVPKRKIRVLQSFDLHAEADRIQSEEASRTLKDEANAPSTAIARDYWFTVFQHFAANTLAIGKLERYVLCLCGFLTVTLTV
jgi:hypothetical protein